LKARNRRYYSNKGFAICVKWFSKNYKTAAKAGKNAIAEHFENSNGNIFEWMSCDVCYDRENDLYYVRTYYVNPLIAGGAYDVIIKSDGTIIAIWGEK